MQVTQRTMDQNGDILGPFTAMPHSDNKRFSCIQSNWENSGIAAK